MVFVLDEFAWVGVCFLGVLWILVFCVFWCVLVLLVFIGFAISVDSDFDFGLADLIVCVNCGRGLSCGVGIIPETVCCLFFGGFGYLDVVFSW